MTCCDAPACITNAMGGTMCYCYDIRGRKTAEYGTAIQPACFAYDEADHMVALTTFRVDEGDITSDPSGRTDGDTTTWLYSYNHLGQRVSVCDASGLRELSYDAYGRMDQETCFGAVESCLQEDFDIFGRSAGYRLMIGTRTIQHSHLDYDSKGAMMGMNLEGLASPFTWEYDKTSGCLNRLTYPNGMVRQNTYHPVLNLIASIGYETPGLNSLPSTPEYPFVPAYDADGNQTRIKTSTGIWEVSYDANDRPVTFISQDGLTIATCGYDYMGRRFEKKVTVNGSPIIHTYYLYREYLQIAELDLMHPRPMLEKSYLWDPTKPTATRILMMTQWKKNTGKQEEHFYFMHDALKNVTSIFEEKAERRGCYEYAPFGSLLTTKGNMAEENKFRFSCEYSDDELGLVYYNYRYLNPMDGRWISRDPIAEQGGWNLYGFVKNNMCRYNDVQGCISYVQIDSFVGNAWIRTGAQYYFKDRVIIDDNVYYVEALIPDGVGFYPANAKKILYQAC